MPKKPNNESELRIHMGLPARNPYECRLAKRNDLLMRIKAKQQEMKNGTITK